MTASILNTIIAAVRTNLPAGITEAYLDGFVDRHRETLLAVLDAVGSGPQFDPGTSGSHRR